MATDHFEKHYYGENHVDWNFNVTFNNPDVTRMVEQYAAVIKHPALYDPIPAKWLHSTILRVGLLQNYTDDEMLAVAAKLETKLADLKLPEFQFDSWWLWHGNITLHISPDDIFEQIYTHTIEALQEVVGADRTTKSPHGQFIAHTGLAYTKTHNLEHELHEMMSNNPVKPASFRANTVSLIKQWPTDGHYEWEVIKDIPIGQC